VRSSGFKPKGPGFRPGATGEGKTGRVNNREPLMMSRYHEPRVDGVAGPGCRGCAVAERQAAAVEWTTAVGAPLPPGYRGHPIRSYLKRVERDNPDGVRAEQAR
jgi:hypothetical protein